MSRDYEKEKVLELGTLIEAYLKLEDTMEAELARVREQRVLTLSALEAIDQAQKDDEVANPPPASEDWVAKTKKGRGRPVGSKNKPKKVTLYREYKDGMEGLNPKDYRWNHYIGYYVHWANLESINWRLSPCHRHLSGEGCHLQNEKTGKICAYYHDDTDKKYRADYDWDLAKVEWKSFESEEEYFTHASKMRQKCRKEPRFWEADAVKCKICKE